MISFYLFFFCARPFDQKLRFLLIYFCSCTRPFDQSQGLLSLICSFLNCANISFAIFMAVLLLYLYALFLAVLPLHFVLYIHSSTTLISVCDISIHETSRGTEQPILKILLLYHFLSYITLLNAILHDLQTRS